MSQNEQNNVFPEPQITSPNPNTGVNFAPDVGDGNLGFSFDKNEIITGPKPAQLPAENFAVPNPNLQSINIEQNQVQSNFQNNPQNQVEQISQFQPTNQPYNQNQNQPQNSQPQNQQYQQQIPNNYQQNSGQYYNQQQSGQYQQGQYYQNQPQQQPPKSTSKISFAPIVGFFAKFKIPIIVGLSIVILLVGGLFGFSEYNRQNKPKNINPYTNITATIDGPKTLPQGTPGRWDVKIINNEPVPINDVDVEMQFDKDLSITQYLNYQPINQEKTNFKTNKIDGLGLGQNSFLISFEGFLNAQVDIETMMQGKITYTPAPLVGQKNSQRQLEIAGLRTKIISPEVKLSIDPTNGSIQNGGEVEYVIKVKNTKDKDLQDLRLKLEYPSGNVFSYTSSQFTASNTAQNKTSPDDGDNTWFIPRLAGLTEQSLSVKGILKVKSQQKVEFGAELSMKNASSTYRELAKSFKGVFVSSQPVIISTRIDKDNKTFVPGETLKVSVDYFNQSQEVLKNVEIIASMDDKSNLLDLASFSFVGGSRAEINNNQIQWAGVNTPQLVTVTPQTRGKLNYTVKVKKDLLDQTKPQSEYTIKPQVAIQAANLQPISQSGDTYKMRSNLRFTQLPTEEVKIDNKTQANRRRYKLTWKVANEQNEIDELVVKAFTRLPPSAWQKASVTPSESNLEYNPNNGEIIWKIPKIESYTGIDEAKPAITVSFELEVEIQNGKLITLLESPTISARDNFTGEVFNLRGKVSENKITK
jgi:hypothetical protein